MKPSLVAASMTVSSVMPNTRSFNINPSKLQIHIIKWIVSLTQTTKSQQAPTVDVITVIPIMLFITEYMTMIADSMPSHTFDGSSTTFLILPSRA